MTEARFWTQTPEAAASALGCGLDGLSAADAAARLASVGPNLDAQPGRVGLARALVRRLTEPLGLVLLAAAAVSWFTGDAAGAILIAAILALSNGLDALQERRALRAAELLRRSVAVLTEVKRGGTFVSLPAEDIVPGDLVRIRAGDVVPADALVVGCEGFSTTEAGLTGEPYPVEKRPGASDAKTAAEAANALFRGSVAQTGEATGLVVATGRQTLFGGAAAALAQPNAPSPFEHDLRALGLLIVRMTVLLVLFVLGAHVLLGRPFLQSLMFAVALAVGLTPELLPMITTVTLARGAVRMAARKVIVKRLASIHDLGAMTVLCTDKTGTLTSAEITLAASYAADGREDGRPATLAAVCAALAGDRGALDAALVAATPPGSGWSAVARRAFDFRRRLGSVIAAGPDGTLLIVKGAPESVLALCARRRAGEGTPPLTDDDRAAVHARLAGLAQAGLRVVAVASKPEPASLGPSAAPDETDMVFEGLCAFADPPKATAAAALTRLAGAGVRVKVLSGDDPIVVRRLAGLVGMTTDRVLTGADIAELGGEALAVQAREVDLYARLAPDQKARLVQALQSAGEVVGFLGDGINDAPGLKSADIGLSVDGASGVAREAADMILLQSDLGVVADGVEEGRRTFANILKYVRMGASSNFGNMLSMAAASVLLPFLPMLPTQILLNNLLYDVSEIGLPFDRVSPREIDRPQVWRMADLIRFGAVMGPLSSAFDLATFALLAWGFHLPAATFRTGWFLESMATQILVIFLIRTREPFWRTRAHVALIVSSLGALAVAIALPFSVAGPWLAFETPPLTALAALSAIVLAYLACAEVTKRWAMGRPPAAIG